MRKAYPNLRAYLDAEGIQQAAFAKVVNISEPMLSQILRGGRCPSLPVAIRIAREANVPVESLLTEAA
jgi:transcriptional regulator with XRE-family HTH domain